MQKYFWVDIRGTVLESKTKKPLPGASEAIEYLAQIGFKVIGVTNEGGCAKINPATNKTWKSVFDVIKEQENILQLFPQMESVYFCPTFDRISYCYQVKRGRFDAMLLPAIFKDQLMGEMSCRKPGHGMLVLSTEGEETDWSNSWIAGDKDKDPLCAAGAGVNFIWADIFRSRFGGAACEEPSYPTKMIQKFDALLSFHRAEKAKNPTPEAETTIQFDPGHFENFEYEEYDAYTLPEDDREDPDFDGFTS